VAVLAGRSEQLLGQRSRRSAGEWRSFSLSNRRQSNPVDEVEVGSDLLHSTGQGPFCLESGGIEAGAVCWGPSENDVGLPLPALLDGFTVWERPDAMPGGRDTSSEYAADEAEAARRVDGCDRGSTDSGFKGDLHSG